VKAENRLKLVKAVLARVVGIDNNYELKEAQPSVYSSTSNDMIFIAGNCKVATIDCLKENALAERAEFKSVNMQKKIAEEQVKYAKGAYLPTLSIEGVYSKKDDNPAAASFVKESIYGGIKLNFPFFEGGLRKAEAREAESKLRQSELAYEDLKKTIHIEVENAYLDLITQKGILKSLEDQAAFARDNYNAVSRQFDFGLANSLDVMDANTLLVTAERQLIDAQYNYQLSILKLKHSTGTLLKAIINRQAAAATLNKK
jgi:outer membrane protein